MAYRFHLQNLSLICPLLPGFTASLGPAPTVSHLDQHSPSTLISRLGPHPPHSVPPRTTRGRL